MSRRMQTSWKLFLQAAQAGAVGRAVGHGTSKSQAGSLPRTCPHPSAKPPRLTGAEAGWDQAKKSGRPQHRDVLKEVEAASREEPGKSPKSARTKRGRKVRWLRAHRCSRGSCRSPCKKLPWHKCSGRAGHTNGSSPARGWCVFREAEIWGDEWFGTGFTCASTAFASKTDGRAGKQLRLHRHSVETSPAIRRGTSVVSQVVLQRQFSQKRQVWGRWR